MAFVGRGEAKVQVEFFAIKRKMEHCDLCFDEVGRVGKIWDDKYEKVWYNVIIQIWDKLAAMQRAYYFTWRYAL